MARWAVVSTFSMLEKFVAAELYSRLGIATYLPRLREHIGDQRLREALLFPRYVFADGIDDFHFEVKQIRGACSILMREGKTALVPDCEIDALRAREDRDGFVWLKKPTSNGCKFHNGQKVRVTAGPFSGLCGIVEGMSKENRIAVLFDVMGRKGVRVHTSVGDAEAA